MRNVRLCSILLMCAVCASAVADPPRLADCAELKDLAARWADAQESLGVPGFAVVVVRGDDVILLDAFGLRDPQKKLPVTPDTMFYIASCTKTYVAMAAAALAEDGKLDLDKPVKDYLRRLELPDTELTRTLTVRDLLCHRYGIQHNAIVFNDAYSGLITEDRYFRLLSRSPIAGEVRYTNVHYTLAGRVIEAVSGKRWQDLLDVRIFQPVGMRRTTAYASRMYADENVALPCWETSAGWTVCPVMKTDRTMHAAGGLGTTARDLGRWLRLNLNAGVVDGKRVLSQAGIEQMQTQQTSHKPQGQIRRLEGFGLAWNLGTYRDRPYATHGGGYVGAAAHVSFLPQHKIGVAIVANADGGGQGLCDIVSIDVYDRLLGLKEKDLLPGYKERASEMRRQRVAPSDQWLTATEHLSLAADRYAGRYENEDFGPIEILAAAGSLEVRLGDLKPTLFAGTERDSFSVRVVVGDKLTHGRFEVDRTQGQVSAIWMTVGGDGPERFVRK